MRLDRNCFDISDVNNDGYIDLLGTDMRGSNHYQQKIGMGDMDQFKYLLEDPYNKQTMRNVLYLNTDKEYFFEAAFLHGVDSTDWTWSPKFGDYDNDGYVDLTITNGMYLDFMNSDLELERKKMNDRKKTNIGSISSAVEELDYLKKNNPYQKREKKDSNRAFKNMGNLSFKDVSDKWGFNAKAVSYSSAHGDLDLDGDLDLVINNEGAPLMIYHNNNKAGNSIMIKLIGTISNRQAIGSTIRIWYKNMTEKQIRYHSPYRGFLSTNQDIIHFGLGSEKTIGLFCFCFEIKLNYKFE